MTPTHEHDWLYMGVTIANNSPYYICYGCYVIKRESCAMDDTGFCFAHWRHCEY